MKLSKVTCRFRSARMPNDQVLILCIAGLLFIVLRARRTLGAYRIPRARRSVLAEQLTPAQPSKQEHRLFSVVGQRLEGGATALIIAATEADAEYYALK